MLQRLQYIVEINSNFGGGKVYMETIVIKLNPELLENPDLDLCYSVPDRIEELSDKKIMDNGYDYLQGQNNPIGIWMKTESAEI